MIHTSAKITKKKLPLLEGVRSYYILLLIVVALLALVKIISIDSKEFMIGLLCVVIVCLFAIALPRTVSNLLARLTGKAFPTLDFGGHTVIGFIPTMYYLDTSTLKKFGITPHHSFAAGFFACISWFSVLIVSFVITVGVLFIK